MDSPMNIVHCSCVECHEYVIVETSSRDFQLLLHKSNFVQVVALQGLVIKRFYLTIQDTHIETLGLISVVETHLCVV